MTGRFAIVLAGMLLFGPSSPAQRQSDDTDAAVWILAQGGTLRIEGSGEQIRSTADLPPGPILVREAVLTGALVHPRDLERLSALRGLRRLTLPGTMWNPVCCGTLGNADDSDLIAALAGIESLESLHLSRHFVSVFKGIRVFDHAIEKMVPLKNLRSLQLMSTRVTGAHLDAFEKLEQLDLTQTDVNDEGLASIARLPRLKTLRLRSTRVTDSGLAALSRLAGLVELDLADLELSDEGVAHLAGLGGLRILNLRGASISDAGLGHLSGMQELADLNLYRTRITNAGMPQLAALPGLRSVDLRYTRATSAGIAALRDEKPNLEIQFVDTAPSVAPVMSRMPSADDLEGLLEWVRSIGGVAEADADGQLSLSLKATPVSDREVAAIAEFPSVVHLDLTATDVSDLGLQTLNSLPNLQVLNLANTGVTDSGIVHVAKLRALRELVLDQSLVEGPGLSSLARSNSLRKLSLAGTAVGDSNLESVAGLTQLEVLELDYTQVSDPGVANLATLVNLTELGLTGTRVGDEGFSSIASLPRLRRLSLAFTDVTSEGIGEIGRTGWSGGTRSGEHPG